MSQNSRNQGFFYYFCLMMERSVSGSVLYLWVTDPDPEGPKSYRSGSGCGSGTLLWTYPRRLIRSSSPTEIFQPPQQGFFSVHTQLQLLGKIVRLLGNYIVNMIRNMYKTDWRVWVVTQKQERLRLSLRWDLLLVLCTAFNLSGIKIYISYVLCIHYLA